jgi:hypothetical protein
MIRVVHSGFGDGTTRETAKFAAGAVESPAGSYPQKYEQSTKPVDNRIGDMAA